MNRIRLLLACIMLCGMHAKAQETMHKPGRIIFYNVENLFDTIDEPDKDDAEFLPSGKAKWNSERYKLKLQHIAQVIDSLTDTIQPFVIGLAEVENKQVLEDLIKLPSMRGIDWGIVHHDSPDERGIDVGILYNKGVVDERIGTHLSVNIEGDPTRDIVYLKCYLYEGEPFWIFVNHWPSRRTATDSTGHKRMIVANTLLKKIENLYLGEPFASVIVMGDLNDTPTDSSTQALLNFKFVNPEYQALNNLMLPLMQQGKYTVAYKEQKNIFDQIIVSNYLLKKSDRCTIRNGQAHIYAPNWLLFQHNKYGAIPNRTYSYGKYTGGYSDHLPVYIDVVFK